MERWINYDQISLIPTQVSTLEHRVEADTSVQFGPLRLSVPIIAAPMPDVSGALMARKLAELGALGFIHRFQDYSDAENEIQMSFYPEKIGVAFSSKLLGWPDLKQYGVKIFCLDTANGASEVIHRALGTLKDKYPDIFIIAGNVASPEAFFSLESWGADAIRVGIAGGSVCETRTETGVYSPMASAIQEITRYIDPESRSIDWYGFGYPKHRRALLIADGGIKTPADMCKALALGADAVMIGGALAGTKESPGDIIKLDGKLYKKLRGAASFGVQKETNGEDPNYVEGTETLVPYAGSVEKVINRFRAGLRSSMSYMNAHNLTEYRRNVKIVEVG